MRPFTLEFATSISSKSSKIAGVNDGDGDGAADFHALFSNLEATCHKTQIATNALVTMVTRCFRWL